MNIRLPLASLVVAALPLAAAAEIRPFKPGDDLLSLQLGGSSTGNEYDWSAQGGSKEKAGDPGGALDLQWLHVLGAGPAVALGADLNLAGLKDHESDSAVPDRHSRSRFGSVIVMPMARVGRTAGRVRPYGFAGVGLHATRLQLELTPINGKTWADTGTAEARKITDGSAVGGAISFGGGVDVYLDDSFFLGAELRLNYLGETNYGVTDAGKSLGYGDAKTDLSSGNLFLRAGWRF